MHFGRSLWAIPALAVLSTPVASLSTLFADDESIIAPASVSLTSVPSVSVYISGPGVEGPPALAGLSLETFDGRHSCPNAGTSTVTSGTALAVGTLSAQNLTLACLGAATTSATPMPHTHPSGADYPSGQFSAAAWATSASHASPAIVTLNSPVDYVGVYWFWGNTGDRFVLRSGGQDVITFSTSDLMNLLPTGSQLNAIGGGTYLQNHYLGGRKGFGNGSNTEPMVYLHFVAAPGTTFDEVRLSQGQLEFDNLATVSLSATFDPTGLVGVPLNSYSITYDAQGGSSVASGLYTQGSTVTLAAAPTRTGYEFLGWATTSAGTPLGSTYAPPGTGNITLYAQWRSIVTFDANGGTGASVTQSASGNTALRTNDFTRPGFTFTGWNTTISGTGTNYADGATFTFTTPATLYAQWTPIQAGPQIPLVTTPVATTPAPTTAPGTTAPPSTTPPTPPTTTIPAPIADAAGALPALQPGATQVTDNGDAVPVETFLDDTNTLVLRGQDFQLNLAGDCADGCTVVNDQTGRETIELRQDGNALIDGYGFMPGTLVHIWMFSEPTYLGALTVADDGTFQGSVYLEGIEPGTHTLQVNGTSYDGNNRSANLGVLVVDRAVDTSPTLPTTGGGTAAPQLVLAALTMVMLGFVARRRA